MPTSTPMDEFKDTFRSAKWVSTPLIVIRTTDPTSTTQLIAHELFVPPAVEETEVYPTVLWDVVQGFKAVNDAAKSTAQRLSSAEPASLTGEKDPREALVTLQAQVTARKELPRGTIVCFANAHRYWNDTGVIQAVYNLRDCFPEDNQTLILLTLPGARLPLELADHVLVLDEPLPNRDDLGKVLDDIVQDTRAQNPDFPGLSREDRTHALDALLGLTLFSAQQAVSMSLTTGGLNLPRLWSKKVQTIQQTPGLSVWKGEESFDKIAGVSNVKEFLELIMGRERSPGGIMFIDEIEKHMAGHGTDSSGVKTEMVGTLLSWMQDKKIKGVLFLGCSGTAKSATAKAAGKGKPVITFDFSGMQASRVGESGQNLRTALGVVEAVTDSNPLVIATCNNLTVLPGELLRRFTMGIFFFDLPDAEARKQIWNLYLTKYNLSGELPNDDQWSGHDIEICCTNAFENKVPLMKAAQFIVASGISKADQVRQLRLHASGKYINASKPGPYVFEDKESAVPPSRGRAIVKLAKA
jgi:ATPase family associated with various cellular activities (AAA)